LIPKILGKEIFFNEEKHLYTDAKGNKLTSVTQLIKKYTPQFDPTGEIIKKYAKKHGTTVEEVRKQWDKKRQDSCDYGTKLHASLEHFILTGKIKQDENKFWVEKFEAQRPKVKFLQSEVILADFDLMIAGTTDLICFKNDSVIKIIDFKTNEKLEKYNRFGNKMLYPLDNYYETNFFGYELQLSIYALLLEKMDFFVESAEIFHFNRNKMSLDIHPITFRMKEVNLILEHGLENYCKI